MLKLWFFTISVFVCISSTDAQVETVPANHSVYPFLKSMYLKGALNSYSDIVLPLSRKKIIELLKEVHNNAELLSESELELLCRYEVKMGVKESEYKSYLYDFPSGFINRYKKYDQKHLYNYSDSLVNFNADLLGNLNYLYSDDYRDYSLLVNAGAQIYGSYSDWLGFLIEGSNGTQYHNREVAQLDPRVKTSFTFNHTGINFFDFTQGYLRFENADINFELGRERILWGNGYVNRMLLSDNPPIFDFIKFNITYKALRYDFIHAWLVQPYATSYIDSLTGNTRQKGSKYLALNRIGINPTPNLEAGFSQMIIYANRPFEAAYLNPFLFWESAQRSLGDLDNSFLSLDVRYKMTNGIETSASMIWDDILFSILFKGEFNRVNNRSAWQAGIILSNPVLPENLTLRVEYLQIRPYTFSHPDIGESLTYTNNSYLLGANLQPNSTAFSSEFNYLIYEDLQFNLIYSHILHDRNYYDESDRLIKNVGANIFENLTIYDSAIAPLLDGDIERIDNIKVTVQKEILYGVYISLIYDRIWKSGSKAGSIFLTQLKLFFR